MTDKVGLGSVRRIMLVAPPALTCCIDPPEELGEAGWVRGFADAKERRKPVTSGSGSCSPGPRMPVV